MKTILKITTMMALILMGGMFTSVDHASAQDEKTIVASQMASDGEVQVTYSDGTSESFYVDSIATEKIEVESILTESTETFHVTENEIGVEFTDGSWASVNTEKNHYEFQPVDLGDWSLIFDNQTDFENCIKTYLNK